jgi:spore maturation protein CgeB
MAVGALEHQFVRGLGAAGCRVTGFDIQTPVRSAKNKNTLSKVLYRLHPQLFYRQVQQQLLRFAEEKAPDVILVFKGLELDADTTASLKVATRLLVNYNPDHPLGLFSHGITNRNMVDSLPLYDLHFTYSANIARRLEQERGLKSAVIPFGYDETIRPRAGSASFCAGNVVFLGSWDQERADKLNRLESSPLLIFGNKAWKNRSGKLPNVKKAYQDRELYNEEYAGAIQDALGVINLLRPYNIQEDSHNMRTFEVPGYGGLLLSERTAEQQSFFEEDKEAIYFGSPEELIDKVKFLSTHPGVVQKIKTNSFQRAVRSRYSYQDRAREMHQVFRSLLA